MSDINKTYVFETVLISGGTSGTTSGGTNNTDDYTISGVLNGTTLEFTRLSGNTYSVDLSSLSITGGTSNSSSDDYTISATLSGNILEFSRLSGGTYSVDLSAFSGGTSNTDDYTISATLSGSVIEFITLSGNTYDVDIGSITGLTIGPSIFDIDTLGNTSYVGYGEVNACKIRRIITSSGSTYSALWSNGEETLDKIWENRLSYSYF